MAAIDFNAGDVNPSSGFDPIPAGEYTAVVTESEQKPTKKGDGHYLQLTFEIVEGDYAKRRLWARLNLDNPNEVAVGIARAELSALCRAVNVLHVKDTAQLHDLPVLIKVTKKLDAGGEDRNEIRGYKPVNPNPSAGPNGATVGSPKLPAGGNSGAVAGSAPPWKRAK